ncbi:carboxymuconolactone decarboxylase family protein [Actinoallomurus liliacearum]|uniref:carboxymuconolactone decarboxylase family protein n=1 Tax=Actinoallomurus liliacearum TaxID=1080073 RepID=UPI0031E9F479
MSRLNVPPDVPASAQRILDNVGAQLGFVPNMLKTIASNSAVLEVVTTLQGTLSRVLDAKTRHSIALAVSQANGCSYCLAIHTYVARPPRELGRSQARRGRSLRATGGRQPRAGQRRGTRGLRGAGYTDPQILAIVALAVRFLLTNFINNVNQTDLDIPAVGSVDAAVTQ